jgi:hypothetical protein
VQQTILYHVAAVVRPALRKYLAAEQGLTDALQSEDASAPPAPRARK